MPGVRDRRRPTGLAYVPVALPTRKASRGPETGKHAAGGRHDATPGVGGRGATILLSARIGTCYWQATTCRTQRRTPPTLRPRKAWASNINIWADFPLPPASARPGPLIGRIVPAHARCRIRLQRHNYSEDIGLWSGSPTTTECGLHSHPPRLLRYETLIHSCIVLLGK
eukprot:scaffold19020_cov107-Isochrysis_galbana.AAC.1